MEEGKGNLLILAAVLAQLFVTVSVWLFSSLQMLYVELTPGQNLKNSLLLTFGYLKSSIPAGLIILAGGGLMLLMFPMISFLLAFFCLPGIVALIADLCVWPAMEESFDISLKLREKRE